MTLPSAEPLWARYTETRSVADRNALVEHYVPWVGVIAGRVQRALPRRVDLDDLRGWGYPGLIAAVERYDPEREEATFTTYSWRLIRGAIFDGLRSFDQVRKTGRLWQQKVEVAEEDLIARLHRMPTLDELAAELGMTPERVQAIANPSLTDDETGRPEMYEEQIESPDDAIGDGYEITELRRVVAEAFAALPPRERTVLHLRYVEGLTFREVSEALGVSKPRVSAVVNDGLRLMREEISTR